MNFKKKNWETGEGINRKPLSTPVTLFKRPLNKNYKCFGKGEECPFELDLRFNEIEGECPGAPGCGE